MVTKGSRSVKLHPMVVDVSLALRKYGIKVEAVWRSREDGLIQWADKGSRDFQSDNISSDFVTMQGIADLQISKRPRGPTKIWRGSIIG